MQQARSKSTDSSTFDPQQSRTEQCAVHWNAYCHGWRNAIFIAMLWGASLAAEDTRNVNVDKKNGMQSRVAIVARDTALKDGSKVAGEEGSGSWQWLKKSKIDPVNVTRELNRIWSDEEQAAALTGLDMTSGTISGEGRLAVNFLKAVALERSGQRRQAITAYEAVSKASNSTYAAAAITRKDILGNADTWQDAAQLHYMKLSGGPSSWGWYLVGDRWAYMDSRYVLWETLILSRADRLSFRFLHFIYSHSDLPKQYAYLFLIIALVLIAQVMGLPFHFNMIRIGHRLKSLTGEITQIEAFTNDGKIRRQEFSSLLRREGISLMPAWICLAAQLTYILWVMFALEDFDPQLRLDDARFLWVTNLNVLDLAVLLGSMLIMLLCAGWSTMIFTGELAGQGVMRNIHNIVKLYYFSPLFVSLSLAVCSGAYWRMGNKLDHHITFDIFLTLLPVSSLALGCLLFALIPKASAQS